MKYEVRIKISYYSVFFDFEDINEAAAFLATAVEKLVYAEDDKEVTISMMAIREEK